jgi:nitrogen regulatory protein PII
MNCSNIRASRNRHRTGAFSGGMHHAEDSAQDADVWRPRLMKRIELVIEPAALGRLTEAADALKLSEFDVTEVRCAPGANRLQRQRLYRGREFVVDLVDRLKVDLTVEDEAATRVVHELIENVKPQSVAVLRLDRTAVTAVDNTRPSYYAQAALRA